jgi:transcriptional regulator with XRE-family HTH domain
MTSIDFPDWLQAQLDDRGMTAYKLSKLSGKDQGVISRILSRERNPESDTLIAIAKGLKLPVEVVLRAAGILPPPPGPLSEEQQAVIHAVGQVSDVKILRMISAMLDQALEEKDRDRKSRK